MVLLALLPLSLPLQHGVNVYARLHQYKICNFKQQFFERMATLPKGSFFKLRWKKGVGRWFLKCQIYFYSVTLTFQEPSTYLFSKNVKQRYILVVKKPLKGQRSFRMTPYILLQQKRKKIFYNLSDQIYFLRNLIFFLRN